MDTFASRPHKDDLFARLIDEDDDVAYGAGRALMCLGVAILPPTVALASDPNPRARELACYVLGQLYMVPSDNWSEENHSKESAPALVRLLEADPQPSVRAGAAAALGFQKQHWTLPMLCRAAEDPFAEVRFDVACALGSFYEATWENPEALPHRDAVCGALLKLMDDEDDEVRDWATFGMHQGGHDTPEVMARLYRALDDPSCDVRGEAACGLAKYGDRGVIPHIDRLLREDEDISPCYFQAAEELGDPVLLQAVLFGAERWKECMEEGEEMHCYITSAIENLTERAREQGQH